jgi:hypothetical protein
LVKTPPGKRYGKENKKKRVKKQAGSIKTPSPKPQCPPSLWLTPGKVHLFFLLYTFHFLRGKWIPYKYESGKEEIRIWNQEKEKNAKALPRSRKKFKKEDIKEKMHKFH